uniref:Reverse transcriptase domain-containing protein n=1 Tax=Plectus sambesii TaxID=2011161 RepID=A0A914VPX7_9BILA
MKLKQPTVAAQFKLELRNRFQALADCEEAEEQGTLFRATLAAIAEVKRSCHQDKRKWVEKKGAEAQEAADRNDSKTLYRIVRELTGSSCGHGAPIRDKAGNPLLKQDEQEKRWVEHFKDTQNQPAPTVTFDNAALEPVEEFPANLGPVTNEETKTAVHLLKNGKVAGLDEVAPEMLKYGGPDTINALTNLINVCWDKLTVPEDWRRGVIIRLPKKGDLSKCNNWQGITLLSVPGKVLCIVLLRRLRQAIDDQLREQQAGFRCGRSCNKQIFILRLIIEQSLEYQQRLSTNFIDFVKAFDSMHRESLWSILHVYGVPNKFIDLFRDLY